MLKVQLVLVAWGLAITIMACLIGMNLVTHNHGFKAIEINQVDAQTNQIQEGVCLVWWHSGSQGEIILCDVSNLK